MNTPDPMPSNFGLKYIFWIAWRWVYYNPLTLLLALQGVLVQLVVDYPSIKWLSTACTVFGVIVAQVRNRGKDYTVPIKPVQP